MDPESKKKKRRWHYEDGFYPADVRWDIGLAVFVLGAGYLMIALDILSNRGIPEALLCFIPIVIGSFLLPRALNIYEALNANR